MHKTVMPTVWFLAAIVFAAFMQLVFPFFTAVKGGLRFGGGILFLAAGIVLNLAADGLFKKKGTAVRTDLKPSSLIVSGPFMFTRNPMYLGMAFALAGIAFILGAFGPFLSVPAFMFLMDRLYIPHEEKTMSARFGKQYAIYKNRVRRWV